jgi:anaerobic selenocysteine-containing dehydrogenase
MDLMFRGGGLLGKMLGKPNSFSFNPKNYYRLLLGTMGRVSFGKLIKNSHGVKACDIKFGTALKKMATPSKKVDVAPAEFVAALNRVRSPARNPERYPLTLITGERSPYSKNTHLRNITALTQKQPENFLRISSEDAGALSISDGTMVEVLTRNGSVEVPAKLTSDIRPGVVSLPHGWGRNLFHPENQTNKSLQGANSNALTEAEELDELSGMPIYNSLPCAVRKLAG